MGVLLLLLLSAVEIMIMAGAGDTHLVWINNWVSFLAFWNNQQKRFEVLSQNSNWLPPALYVCVRTLQCNCPARKKEEAFMQSHLAQDLCRDKQEGRGFIKDFSAVLAWSAGADPHLDP